jgi:nicotinamidase-related amidase
MNHHETGLRYGPLGDGCVHLCVDMQRLFAEETDWQMAWADRVLPNIARIAAAHPDRDVFTRFMPVDRPGEGEGTWRRYYKRWDSMTLENLGVEMADLVPDLQRFVPPGTVIDKRVYSPWVEPELDAALRARSIDTTIVTGGETDVCVLATVLGAVDRGYRVLVVMDALCSSSDETHDTLLDLYRRRYGQQIETITTDDLLEAWSKASA